SRTEFQSFRSQPVLPDRSASATRRRARFSKLPATAAPPESRPHQRKRGSDNQTELLLGKFLVESWPARWRADPRWRKTEGLPWRLRGRELDRPFAERLADS